MYDLYDNILKHFTRVIGLKMGELILDCESNQLSQSDIKELYN